MNCFWKHRNIGDTARVGELAMAMENIRAKVVSKYAVDNAKLVFGLAVETDGTEQTSYVQLYEIMDPRQSIMPNSWVRFLGYLSLDPVPMRKNGVSTDG